MEVIPGAVLVAPGVPTPHPAPRTPWPRPWPHTDVEEFRRAAPPTGTIAPVVRTRSHVGPPPAALAAARARLAAVGLYTSRSALPEE